MCSAKANMTGAEKEDLMCPIRYLFNIFGGKWKLPIVCILAKGKPARYSAIKRRLGDITNVMLAQSLKELEAFDIIYREQFNEVPPRVEYTLTDKGKSVLPLIIQLGKWSAINMQNETACGVYCDECKAIR